MKEELTLSTTFYHWGFKMSEELTEKPNSVTISVNAKGLWSGHIKVYEANIDEAYESAFKKAEQLEEIIKEKNKSDVL